MDDLRDSIRLLERGGWTGVGLVGGGWTGDVVSTVEGVGGEGGKEGGGRSQGSSLLRSIPGRKGDYIGTMELR